MVVLAAAVGALLLAASSRTGGELVYALDDAYIHMAVGRNLADHGVWGVTRYAFTSSTSSLLWPLLLALADLVAGAREATPLVLNLVFAAAAVLTADRLLAGATPGIRLVALAALVLLSPLPTLVVSGMEHALHIAAVLWLLDAVRAALADGVGPHGSADVASTRGATAGLLASAAVATA
ncbi:MAG TPA: hypothetical protein VMR21_03525, partial [Vicinamibacteria bacterium]|nr:hypothetical protein [Vicinamibacteria bacterium]